MMATAKIGRARDLHQPALWDAVSAYENSYVVRHFAEKHDVSVTDAEELFREMKRFLYLGYVLGMPCSPSKAVDEMWHEFINHTAAYRDFCGDHFGEYIDHFPSDQPELTVYTLTRDAALEIFGPLDEGCWPIPTPLQAGNCSCSNKGCSCNCSNNVRPTRRWKLVRVDDMARPSDQQAVLAGSFGSAFPLEPFHRAFSLDVAEGMT